MREGRWDSRCGRSEGGIVTKEKERWARGRGWGRMQWKEDEGEEERERERVKRDPKNQKQRQEGEVKKTKRGVRRRRKDRGSPAGSNWWGESHTYRGMVRRWTGGEW